MSASVVGQVIDHAGIAARIPHHGSMCLLNTVQAWSEAAIECRAISHTDGANPLRSNDQLGAAQGIEYAAQAMAVHGALLAGAEGPPRQGYLTSVRGVNLHVTRLDDLPGELDVRAERLSGDHRNILYQFSVSHQGHCLLEGRAAVVIDASALVQKAAP